MKIGHHKLIALLGPAALVFAILSLTRVAGISRGSELIPTLDMLAPIVGVVVIINSQSVSGVAKFILVIAYYPMMLAILFPISLMFGCAGLKMYCF
ncbi:hypothetical protein [Propionivibrio soli]|uniref:hypothetical protein n=1 Tax=Propionivibrio soli TaxID=2976531 RepID=UPI0021E94237|nr:hypothetical protein [Propionivibrio soli]